MRCRSTLAALLLLTAAATGQDALPYRQVAAPPVDFLSGRLRLPDPRQSAERSRSAWIAVRLAPDGGGGWSFEAEFPVAANGALRAAAIGADALAWRVLIGSAHGPLRDASLLRERGELSLVDEALPGLAGLGLELPVGGPGSWRVRIESPVGGEGWLALRDAGRVVLESWIPTRARLAGEPVPLVARVRDAGDDAIAALELIVELGGAELRETMHDDGRHGDGRAGDGLHGALLPSALEGELRARVEARGTGADGRPFLRTTHHRLWLLAPALRLEGTASASVLDAGRARVSLAASALDGFDPARHLLVAAELWGRDAEGLEVPVVWLARVLRAEASSSAGGLELPLALDERWVERAGAVGPFELRAVRVQDPGHHVVLASQDRVPLGELPRSVFGSHVRGPAPAEPGFDMLGAPWSSVQPIGPRAGSSAGRLPHALLLSHGHCAGGNPWPAADFTPPLRVFSDPNADRTNDEFAQLMLAQTADLHSFGVLGHSQGGLAALQLYTFYVSGLDRALGPRRIQSLASPYQGTPLASFSAGCGTDNDLTPDEAAAWLSTIPSWARAAVWFRTVSDAGQACNFFTDFLLADPEDGVVEVSRGDLPGGNALGDTQGWCHTTGMVWPAGYLDHAANQQMDARAAR